MLIRAVTSIVNSYEFYAISCSVCVDVLSHINATCACSCKCFKSIFLILNGAWSFFLQCVWGDGAMQTSITCAEAAVGPNAQTVCGEEGPTSGCFEFI